MTLMVLMHSTKVNSIKKQDSSVPTILLLICLGLDLSNRVFSNNVTAAILVSQNNETAAMLVSQARWLKTRAEIELWIQREVIVMCVKRLSMVVP